MATVYYLTIVAGALVVYLLLPRARSWARWGGLLGAGVLGLTLLHALSRADEVIGINFYFYIFTIIAIVSAVRVITHPRPVYSALYFIMVVLASAGLLVLLQAQFMAVAMIIIYAGAILVTYMFVIMLATMPQSVDDPVASPVYDRLARQPLLSVTVGFVLLAVLSHVIVNADAPPQPYPDQAATATAAMAKRIDLTHPRNRERITTTFQRLALIESDEYVHAIDLDRQQAEIKPAPLPGQSVSGARSRVIELDEATLNALLPNMDRVGLNLFQGHTLGIELAAVVLMVAMVGAIVLARQRVPEPLPGTTL